MFGNVKEIDVQTLMEWLSGHENGKGMRLLDVRSAGEIERGMIPAGEAMPLHTIPLKVHELDHSVPTVLYCQSGARSAQACVYLSQQGHENVFNLRGGILDWAQRGMPTVSPREAVA